MLKISKLQFQNAVNHVLAGGKSKMIETKEIYPYYWTRSGGYNNLKCTLSLEELSRTKYLRNTGRGGRESDLYLFCDIAKGYEIAETKKETENRLKLEEKKRIERNKKAKERRKNNTKKDTSYTFEDVKRVAYKYIYSYPLPHYFDIRKRLDFRTKFDNEVYNFIKNNPIPSEQKILILEKRKFRAFNRPYKFVSMFENTIIKDYQNNKSNLIGIYSNFMRFLSGRNHWAKNQKDLKILEILRKKYLNK